jgi:hypothetical protein
MVIDMNRRNWNKKINPHLSRSMKIDKGKRREKSGLHIHSTNIPWEGRGLKEKRHKRARRGRAQWS